MLPLESKILLWCKLSSLALLALAGLIFWDEWSGYEARMDKVLAHQAEMSSQGEITYGILCGTPNEPSWISIDSASYFRIQDRDSICLYTTHWRGRIRGFLDQRHSSYSERFEASAWTLTPLVEVWGFALIMAVLSLLVWIIPDFSIRVGIWFFAAAMSIYLWWFSVA